MKDYRELLKVDSVTLINAGFQKEDFEQDERELNEQLRKVDSQLRALETIQATIKSGWGIGDIITDGDVVYKVVGRESSCFWKGYKRKKDGTFGATSHIIYSSHRFKLLTTST